MVDTQTTSPHTQVFQFTLGPVQGFVAQARRTRDFWAGSFILSWLSSVAIAAIQKQGGNIQFPVPDPVYLRTLYGTADMKDAWPQQGSIPNRFMATTATVAGDFRPEWVSQAVKAAWRGLAEAVWQGDLAGYAGEPTRQIWERQIENFWEISWVLSDGSQPGLLDQRKNWRNPVLPAEPGHKCMMMDGWQELSGVTATNMQPVNSFWKQLSEQGQTGIASDLGGEGLEHLCAMAYVKRRFSRYFAKVKVSLPGTGGEIHGWEVPSAVPSVAFLAAAPWLARVIDKVPQAFKRFHEAAIGLVGATEAAHVGAGSAGQSGFEIDIACVRQAAERVPDFKRVWAGLDGQVYFDSALENHQRVFGPNLGREARAVSAELSKLVKAADLGRPSPYYAILLMDGDQLGKHMGDPAKQTPISQALNRFTSRAGDIVREHNGFLIYAGGDDVLALLSLDNALPAAAALQKDYAEAFAAQSWPGEAVRSTLSGAIEFVHFRTPLTRVLTDAHKLLDKVAKDQTGRNAIAVRVWKPSGLAVQWAMPWEKALDEAGVVKITRVAAAFAGQGEDDAEGRNFSNKFFFRMQSLLERFDGKDPAVLQALLLAEYLHSYGDMAKRTQLDLDQLKDHLNGLLEQCWQYRRPQAGAEAALDEECPLNPEGALLVRFLAQKGLERA